MKMTKEERKLRKYLYVYDGKHCRRSAAPYILAMRRAIIEECAEKCEGMQGHPVDAARAIRGMK